MVLSTNFVDQLEYKMIMNENPKGHCDKHRAKVSLFLGMCVCISRHIVQIKTPTVFSGRMAFAHGKLGNVLLC